MRNAPTMGDEVEEQVEPIMSGIPQVVAQVEEKSPNLLKRDMGSRVPTVASQSLHRSNFESAGVPLRAQVPALREAPLPRIVAQPVLGQGETVTGMSLKQVFEFIPTLESALVRVRSHPGNLPCALDEDTIIRAESVLESLNAFTANAAAIATYQFSNSDSVAIQKLFSCAMDLEKTLTGPSTETITYLAIGAVSLAVLIYAIA